MRHSGRILTGIVAGALLAGALAASDINKLPPNNWSVPRSTGVHTLTDATPPRTFIGLPPCRLVDTRGTGGVPINTGGSFAADEVRTWTFTELCGIPVGANAVSLNITVTNTGGQTAFGFVKVWPGGGTEPNVSTLNWSTAGVTVANAAVVPFSGGGTISLRSGNNSSDVIVDTNGYFANFLGTPTNGFRIDNTSPTTAAIVGNNTSPACMAGCGVVGFTASTSGAVAVDGVATAVGAAGIEYGVRGITNSATDGAAGTVGNAAAATGVTDGVLGTNASTANNSTGVYGFSSGTGGATFGVVGNNSSGANDAGGVLGFSTGRTLGGATGAIPRSGVRGESQGAAGVTGMSNFYFGVAGYLLSTTGTLQAAGILGGNFGTAGNLGVSYNGGLGGSGTKSFFEPHPTDASKMIRYVSLEGPEAGTYFRGTAKTVGGMVTIEVPETFRIVTDDDGLTVQLTPIGAAAAMYIVSEDLNRIVVHSSRDVTFHYLVQGVRRAYKDFEVVTSNFHFVPRSPDERMPEAYSEVERQRLISNGTYNPDGTVNMQTAERLGWAKVWKQHEEEVKAEAPPAQK